MLYKHSFQVWLHVRWLPLKFLPKSQISSWEKYILLESKANIISIILEMEVELKIKLMISLLMYRFNLI